MIEEGRANLGGAAEVDGDGPREDGVAEGGAAEVVDAELHPGDAAVARGHVRAHARQRLRQQRRHAAVQHLEGLPGPAHAVISQRQAEQPAAAVGW